MKKVCTLANFNCTFTNHKGTYPMLDFFKTIVFPALSDKKLARIGKPSGKSKTTNKFYIADLKLIECEDGEHILIGKHYKKTILEIKQDFDPTLGAIPVNKEFPSAPFSTFILLLKNHRLVYFPDQQGSPDVRSFNSTIRFIINEYIQNKRKDIVEQYDGNYVVDGVDYGNAKKFLHEYVDLYYPYGEINVIAIESKELVKSKFKEISKINHISFKVYKLNADVVNYDSIFGDLADLVETTNSTQIEQKIISPENKEEIYKMVSSSDGKSDYVLAARDINNNPMKLTPDKVSTKVTASYSEDLSLENNCVNMYNELKGNDELHYVSDDNIEAYNRNKVLF